MDDDHIAAHKLQSAFGGDGKPRSPGISIAGLRRTSSRGRIYGVGIAEDKIDREFTGWNQFSSSRRSYNFHYLRRKWNRNLPLCRNVLRLAFDNTLGFIQHAHIGQK